MNEAMWVAQAQAGDEEAFEKLLAPHRPKLLAYVARRIPRTLARKVTAEDVLQEASLTAFQRIARFEYRGEGAFRAWIWQIAQLKLQEAIRHFAGTDKRGAAAEIPRGQRRDTRHFEGHRTTPSQRVSAHELRERIDRAMARLSEDHRTVLQLVRVEAHSIADAAEVMGRTYEATKKLYARAVAALSEAVDEDLADEDP